MGRDATLEKLLAGHAERAIGLADDVPANVCVLPPDDHSAQYRLRSPGHTYRNRAGMQFMVANYAQFGFKHTPARLDGTKALELFHGDRPPTSVLPVIAHLNPSQRLRELYREVLAVTPRHLLIADAAGLPEECRQIMDGLHFTSWREYPELMVVVVDSGECREDILAHELMHIWLDLVADYEDHRIHRDPSDGRGVFTVISVQSFVIDCKVQEKLIERGFPLRQFTSDIVDTLHQHAVATEAGFALANRSQEAVMARLLARPWAVPELYEFTEDDWEKIRHARRVIECQLPRLARLADGFVKAFRRHRYTEKHEALKLIDECLGLQFGYIQQDFDQARDLRIEPDRSGTNDRFMPNAPAEAREDVLRRLVRGDWPIGTRVVTKRLKGGRFQVTIGRPSSASGGSSAAPREGASMASEHTTAFEYDRG